MWRDIVLFSDSFDRAQVLSTTPGQNGWTIFDTSSSGTPTYLCASGLGMVLTLDNTNEAQVVNMYHNDVLQFDVDQIKTMEFVARVTGIDSATTLVMGLASARNSDPDNVAYHTWFRISGSSSTSAVLVESDNDTSSGDLSVATGLTLSSGFKAFKIDFTNSKGDVRFYMGDSFESATRVGASTKFTMAGYTGLLQPYFQLQKASGTGTPSVAIRKVKITHQLIGS